MKDILLNSLSLYTFWNAPKYFLELINKYYLQPKACIGLINEPSIIQNAMTAIKKVKCVDFRLLAQCLFLRSILLYWLSYRNTHYVLRTYKRASKIRTVQCCILLINSFLLLFQLIFRLTPLTSAAKSHKKCVNHKLCNTVLILDAL